MIKLGSNIDRSNKLFHDRSSRARGGGHTGGGRSASERVFSYTGSVLALAAASLFLIAGCAKRQPSPPKVTFRVHAHETANNGQPFHILFRMVDPNVFLTETYQDVAGIIFEQEEDLGVLAVKALMPGSDVKIKIVKPENMAIGIYCLYTDPGDQWKVRIVPPIDGKYEIVLEENRIRAPERKSKKGFFKRLFSGNSYRGRRAGIVNPYAEKAGGRQRQGADGAAVVRYRKPLATQDLAPSGLFSIGV